MRRYGYSRVSTADQNLDLQLDALKRAGCERIFKDKISGKRRDRVGLDRALAALGNGDRLIVWKLDRLGRSFNHLCTIAEQIQAKGAHLVSITENIDTSSNIGNVIYRLMSVFADFERGLIAERTAAGLAAAKARGQKLGRRPKLTRAQIIEADALLRSGMKAEAVAFQFGVGRSTLFRARHLLRR